MIEIGKYNELQIFKQTDEGLILKDPTGEDEVLLPTKYYPENFEINDSLSVFVYLDSTEKKVATTQAPKIQLYEFALLQVAAITQVGAFLNWDLDKDLLVPFNEQKLEMLEGRWYVVYLDLDDKNRLFASSKIDRQLQNINITVKEGDKVDIIIYQQTDLGYSVIINNEHKGLIYKNEIFTKLNIGDKLKAYVKKVRDDDHIDISLQAIGYRNFNDNNSTIIYKKLVSNNGSLAITDKSTPEEIKAMFGLSKKAFKRSIGALYKDRVITIEETEIKLV